MKRTHYSYSQNDRAVLKDINLNVKSGEHIAIVGASGSGKSTLLKIILGLIEPTAGNVYIDGVSVYSEKFDLNRSQMNAVLADHNLLRGNILENITFNASVRNLEFVKECAQATNIDDEISALKMGYYTEIGDFGASLSSGQIQRVLIARALYQRPKILILDEATNHLDKKTETKLFENLKKLSITVINVSHDDVFLKQADRTYSLKDCTLVETSSKS